MNSMDIKNAGLKVTTPRMRILQILQEGHLTAEEIYKELAAQGSEVGLATVYRVLTQFENAGLVIKHNFGDGRAVYELAKGEHHDHLVCIKCGKVEEFVDDVIEQRQAQIAKEKNFKMTDHSLHIIGFCASCS